MNTKFISLLCSATLLAALLLTAVSFSIFGNMEYFRKEFEKYQVTDNIDMEMDDIMYMMGELMDYLHGGRENLEEIIVKVDGTERDFFSEREKIHMADCKKLFDGGFLIRNCCAAIAAVSAALLALKKELSAKLVTYMGLMASAFTGLMLLIALAAAANFDKCFVLFHKLFFDNDMWLLDPAEDLVINILVEPFFADMAIKIAVYCGIVLIIFIAAAIFRRRRA